MTLARARWIAGVIEYRPGWEFFVTKAEFPFDGIVFHVKAHVMNAYKHDEKITIHASCSFQTEITEQEFLDRVFYLIVQMERHEAQEFFQYQGRRVRDPHEEEIKELERSLDEKNKRPT